MKRSYSLSWIRTLFLGAIISLILIFSRPVIAQENSTSIFGGGSIAQNFAKESVLAFDNGLVQCGIYRHGSGITPNFFGGLTIPFESKWSIVPEINFANLSSGSRIIAHETPLTPQAYDTATHQYVSITRSRNYTATIRQLGISMMASYSIASRANISAGPFFGYLLDHSYLETENITSPSTAVYSDGYNTRTISSGDISGVNAFQFGMALEASYAIPVEPHLALRPSLNAIFPFTRINPSLWTYVIKGSLALEYHFENLFAPEPAPPIVAATVHAIEPPMPAPKPLPTVPITPPKKTMLAVSVKALGIEKSGKEVSEPVISIEREHVTEVYPMLHYIFFDDGSSDIPSRYYISTPSTRESFNEKDLYTSNALDIHHHVLDILGKRLIENATASVTLVGTRSEHSEGDSTQGNTVALARAKSVQEYLADVWGISRSRLYLRTLTLPEIASDDHNAFGQAENRRVEIIPSSPELTAPLWTERIERVATPPQIDFEPEITANAGIRSATISVFQHGKLLYKIDALDSTSGQYNWTIGENSMPDDYASVDSLRYVFTAIDSLSDTAEASGVIHLRKEAHDTSLHAKDSEEGKQLDRYSLILFDYSSSSLDKKESETIVHAMAEAIRNGSNILLTGHTDKTGDDAFNDKLSKERVDRAQSMLDAALEKLHKSHEPITAESRGSRDTLFDNSIPEGRVLSRTVRAVIDNGGE